MRPHSHSDPWKRGNQGRLGAEHVTKGGGRRGCAAISHALENHDSWGNAKERPTLQCCAKSQSARYRLDIISGIVFKILSGYISVGTWSQGGWRPFRRDPRTDSSQLVGEWTAEPTTLAQTTLTMVGVSEIGGSRLTLDELSPDSPLSVTTARPRERARGGRQHTHDGRHRRPSTTTDGWLERAGEGTFIFTLHD